MKTVPLRQVSLPAVSLPLPNGTGWLEGRKGMEGNASHAFIRLRPLLPIVEMDEGSGGKTGMATVTDRLIDFIVETKFEDFSKEVVEASKKLLMDTIGVSLAGSAAAGVEPALRRMRDWGGKPECTAWVFGDKWPSIHAAFLNGMMAHSLDFDDTHANIGLHLGSSLVPTALAAAECVKNVKGRDLIAALVIGVEIASRLGLSILEQDKGWHLTSTCGTFASTAVAGRLLNLDRNQMRNALGIAYSQVSGTLQPMLDGALAKRMQPGFSARSGMLSALFAKDGLTGSKDFLEGKFGFFSLYQSGKVDFSILTKDLGSRFEMVNLATKPYPCCRLAHSAIDAVFEIMAETNLSLDEIENITVEGSQAMKDLCGKPYQVGEHSEIDAQFSLSYILASTLLKKRVEIEDFSREAVSDQSLAQHIKKIKVVVSPDISSRFACRIEIKMKNGKTLLRRVDAPKGQPENPMSWNESVEKFSRCSKYAAKPLRPDNLEQFIEKLRFLEDVLDSGNLVQFLV